MNVVISFDDGRYDNENACDILKKLNLKATLFVTTGFIDKTWIKPQSWQSVDKPMTIEYLKRLNSNFEIASHTDTHSYDNENVIISIQKLHTMGFTNVCGLSIPNSSINDRQLLNDEVKLRELGIRYVRVGRNKKCYSFFYKLLYLGYRVFKIQFCYDLFNSININMNNTFLYYSLVIKRNDNVKFIENFLKKTMNKHPNATVVLMFHSILKKGDRLYKKDKWSYEEKSFIKLCHFLSNSEKITVKTLKEVVDS